ncbi:Prefoldin subunit 3 [Strongyloides ratti]|uniref:Prefoldin subunit 3 n=1 Tax=Strongyloides ratti TaxID=34506 RepID=A0A090LDF4_STRRB|nr:Prefoldin subunit 3 [Strongyloides ratti]CEF67782.1 Prefoldin subunit 3 [Strongyloides ratti]
MSATGLTLQERLARSGIPPAEIIEDVEEFLSKNKDIKAEDAHQKLQNDYRKYKILESEMKALKEKITENLPDYEQAKQVINFLKMKKANNETLKTSYKLTDEVYQHAEVEDLDSFVLYMGAYVMVEYPLDEGEEFINKNIAAINQRISEIDEELEYILNQITIVEVSTAHFINYMISSNKAKSTA